MPRLDPVHAQLLTEIVYPARRRANELGAFAALNEGIRERITYAAGEDFDRLRTWLYAYRAAAEETPLDQFFARLFGELLSQPNYGFHEDRDAARVASQLVQSARRFRWALENEPWRREAVTPGAGGSGSGGPSATALTTLGRSYLQLAESGAVGALFVPGWRMAEDAVFLAPAYTFLLRNKPVDVQFWLTSAPAAGGNAFTSRSRILRSLAPLACRRALDRCRGILPPPGHPAPPPPRPHSPHPSQHLPGRERLQRKRLRTARGPADTDQSPARPARRRLTPPCEARTITSFMARRRPINPWLKPASQSAVL